MGENHLTYFKIENFKRFDSFEMENLGQFNLLVGDNNVGKTSVLEGLLFDEKTYEWLVKLTNAFILRKIFPSQSFKISDISSILSKIGAWESILRDSTKPLECSFSLKGKNSKKAIGLSPIEFDLVNKTDNDFIINQFIDTSDGQLLRIYSNSEHINTVSLSQRYLSQAKKSFNLLANNTGYSEQLVKKYAQNVNPDKTIRKAFDNIIRILIPNLEETRLHSNFNTESIGIVLLEDDKIYPITRFGDGVVKLARIIIGILSCEEDKRIMIDEIENGIHFSRLKDFWKTVITLCKQFDVQLFATTHSLECQRYFVEALSELGEEYQKDARNISLLENAKGEVKSVTFDFEQFEFALSIGANTRGGQR